MPTRRVSRSPSPPPRQKKKILQNFLSLTTTNSFSPDVVWDLSQEQVEQLGSEDDGTITDRQELTLKLRTLEKGLTDLDAFTARSGAQEVA